MTYQYRDVCNVTGSVYEFGCSYTKNLREIAVTGWSLKLHSDALMPTLGNDICTLKAADLELCDAFMSYFRERENNEAYYTTCKGLPSGRLHVFASPVGIVVERLRGRDVKMAKWTVLKGQMISLVCVPTCPANFSSNRGYIWYKDGVQLNASGTNLRSLTLYPIRFEDAGRYVCVSVGHENSPSSAVNLTVQRAPRHAVSDKSPDGTSTLNLPLTHRNDSIDQSFNYHWKSKSLYTLSVILLASVGIGLLVVMTVAFLMKKIKETEQKKKSCGDSVCRPCGSSSHVYMSLDVPSQTAVYETVGSGRRCSVAYSDYENSGQP